MIVRSISLTLCLTLVCLGALTGCTPPAGEGGTASTYQSGPPDDLDIPEVGDNLDDPGPNTTVASGEVPDFSEQASPSTTTPAGEIPSFGEEEPSPSAPTPEEGASPAES